MSFNLRHLYYVVTVANEGSISGAVKKLGISQSAISAAVAGFEQRLGYELFIRLPSKGLFITPIGRRFINHARHLIDNIEAFENTALGLGKEPSGPIEIACYLTAAPFFMPRIVTNMKLTYPNISINLREGNLEEVNRYLKTGIVDMGITYDIYPESGILFEPVMDIRPHVLLSSNDPLAKKKIISLKMLLNKPMVLFDLPGTGDYFLRLFSHYKSPPKIYYRSTSFEMVRGLVGAGIGFSFGFLPIKTDNSYDGTSLVKVPIKDNIQNAHVVLAMPERSRPTQIVKAFSEVCRMSFDDLVSKSIS